MERWREAGIEVVRTQRLKRVAIHRERFSGTLVRERLSEIAQLEDSAQRAKRGSSVRDRPPVERERLRALAAPVGDKRAEMKDVTRWSPGKRFGPRDDRLGGLGPAVVE